MRDRCARTNPSSPSPPYARASPARSGSTDSRRADPASPSTTPAALESFRTQLRANETSTHDWLLLDFWAETYVATGSYGHIAPVAAYDAETHRVRILDPDRALQGMATIDADSGQPRGYVYVSVTAD